MIDPPRFLDVAPEAAAVIPVVVPRAEISQAMRAAIGEVMEAVRAQGLRPTGPIFTFHRRIDPDVFDFEVGQTVEGGVVEAGRVRPGGLPGGSIARTVYTGPYEGLHAAWEAFDAWIVAQGRIPGPQVWERYLAGPETGGDPSTYRTQLSRPVT